MRAPVPGTTHSTTLHRNECAILETVERVPSVKKLKSGRIENTKSSRTKLQLRPHQLAAKIDSIASGWLYIGGGKRQLTLYISAAMTILGALTTMIVTTPYVGLVARNRA
jgi:hypothetical protein